MEKGREGLSSFLVDSLAFEPAALNASGRNALPHEKPAHQKREEWSQGPVLTGCHLHSPNNTKEDESLCGDFSKP